MDGPSGHATRDVVVVTTPERGSLGEYGRTWHGTRPCRT